MEAIRFLFGFTGRVARGRFWIFGLTLYSAASIAMALDPVSEFSARQLVFLPVAPVLLFPLYLMFGMLSFAAVALGVAIDSVILRVEGPLATPALLALALLPCVVLSWMVVAVGAKRLHDRGKSGWWLIVFVFMPLILGAVAAFVAQGAALFAVAAFALHLWSFIELGCRRGERIANAYGADPLEVPFPT